MVEADQSWPCPRHDVAWQSPYTNCTRTLLEPRLHALPAVPNTDTCIFSPNNASPGSTGPTFPSMKIKKMDEVRGCCLYSNSEGCLKETQEGKPLLNANPASLQKKILIFDHSGNKTRLFHYPVFPLMRSTFVAATKFTQSYDVNEEGQMTHMGQNYPTNYSLSEEFDENHIVNEGSEMHEDTEEINALLDSDDDDNDDDDDDEVTSTDRSPLATKMNNVVQEWFADMKEEIACANPPNKRQKIVDGGGKRSSPPARSTGSVGLNETSEYVSDAESFYSSSHMYLAERSQEVNLLAGETQSKTDKIRESLRVLENIVPGAKGKQPLLVIDGTIGYLKSLMSQTGTLGENHH